MATRRKPKRRLRPKTPARVKKRTRKTRGHHHAELWGLGLCALGLLLASILYLGWNGGVVGGGVADGFRAAIGAAAYVAPVALIALGGLMVTRSALVEVRPFLTGLPIAIFGLMLTLGSAHGGGVGGGLDSLVSKLLGATGSTILGVTTLVAGALLLSGASAGAILRRSGRVMRRAATTRRRPRPQSLAEKPPLRLVAEPPPVDAVEDFPDVISETGPPPLLTTEPEPQEPASLVDDPPTLFDEISTRDVNY